jgi:pimeloyl-ACP methyl ester carboxylesterase
MTTAKNLIVLIPGFLGFDRFGDFSYFRATVGDALRSGFGALPGKPSAPISAVTTDPAGTLVERQEQLIEQLHAFVSQRPGVRLHLVGHSTGGLDAELLLCTPLLAQSAQRKQEATRVLPAIASITTLAAPLAGTSISDAPIARLFAVRGLADFLTALRSKLLFRAPGLWLDFGLDLLALVKTDAAVAQLLHGTLVDGGTVARYVLNLILRRSLAVDLSPQTIAALLRKVTGNARYIGVPRIRIVTVARAQPKPTAEGRLFQDFYDSTYRAAGDDPSVHAAALALTQGIRTGTLKVIGSAPHPTAIDFRDNDGIVNSARQIFPDSFVPTNVELSRIAAIVVADHIDVVGYFEGKNGQPNGFLSSGSNFREPELSGVYAEIAKRIATAFA